MSWEGANGTCHLLQLTEHDNNVTDALAMNSNFTNEDTIKRNMSYWLGIYKTRTCKTQFLKGLPNITELKLDKCSSVENSADNRTLGDCDAKNHAICVKPGETNMFQ